MSFRSLFFFFSSRRRHTRCSRDWSSDVCSSDLVALFGLLKLVAGIGVMVLTAWAAFSFAITDIGWGLVPIFAILLVIGWVISLFVIGLVLRYGPGADILCWGILFVVMPLSGVFYPTEALPAVLRPLAKLLPTTHAFAAARTLLGHQP